MDLARCKAREAIKKIQQQASESGTEEMTMDEIIAEIAEYRKEKNLENIILTSTNYTYSWNT